MFIAAAFIFLLRDFAGSSMGTPMPGYADGVGSLAQFKDLTGLAEAVRNHPALPSCLAKTGGLPPPSFASPIAPRIASQIACISTSASE